MVKRLFACLMTFVIAVIVFQLAWGAEVRKLTQTDVEWGASTDNATSAGGHVGGKIPKWFSSSNGYTDNGYFRDVVTRGPWVDVRAFGAVGDGVTDDTAAIQAAFDSLDNTVGGWIYIPRGTYVISQGIGVWNKNNIRVTGDGTGVTILDSSATTNLPQPDPMNGDGNWGVLAFSITTIPPVGSNTGCLSNLYISDLTVKKKVVLTSPVVTEKHIHIGYYKNIHVERIELIGGGQSVEGLYMVGPSVFWGKVHVLNSIFRDSPGAQFVNTNSGYSEEIVISGNMFDNVISPLQILGSNVIISNNTFRKVTGIGINAGESGSMLGFTIGSFLITGNTFFNLGKDKTGTVGQAFGINTQGGTGKHLDNYYVPPTYPDPAYDSPIMITNNYFYANWSPGVEGNGSMGVVPIEARGNAYIAGNLIAGLQGNSAGANTAIQLDVGMAGGSDPPARRLVYMSHNVIERGWTDNQINWNYVINMAGIDNVGVYYLHGNNLIDLDNTVSYSMSFGSPSEVHFDGDFITGNINSNEYWGVISSATVKGKPLYGSTLTGLRTHDSDDMIFATFTDNAATPSILGGTRFKTANTGATTITNFTGAIKGKTISVVFTDNVTTVQNNANILLSGATNFVATPDDTITLIYDGTKWRELHRSVN